jgi:CRISPR/Cas system CSM-associated protein Csm3 (group 7 of RAMP superfamily)
MTVTLMIATVGLEPGWAVGAVSVSDQAIDRDILLDAHGHPWVPGSALAGSLRAHLAAAEPPADERLMGSRPPHDQAAAHESTVSPLWIVGATFTADRPSTDDGASAGDGGSGTGAADAAGDPAAAVEIVGQTTIDRERGAAAAGPLRFSRLAASSGTLTVYLRHDPAGGQTLTDSDLKLISGWHPTIGRDRTKGSGRATLDSLQHGTVDPATPVGAQVWLSNSGPALFASVATQTLTVRASEAEPWLRERFEIKDGFLTSDGLPSKVTRTRRRLGRPLIPGSAWKGIVRSRTEYILRSRYGERAACKEQPGCGQCPVCAVFGHPGQRGLLSFRDSYIEDPACHPERTQVGIDRVTGGSRDALLYTTQALAAGTVMLQIDALGELPPWVRTAIRHVLRDIHDGLIGVGSRTTRGLGTLRLLVPPDDPDPVIVPELEAAAEPEPAS